MILKDIAKIISDNVSEFDFTLNDDSGNIFLGNFDITNSQQLLLQNVKNSEPNSIAVGGRDKSSYRNSSFNITIVWNESYSETEEVAEKVFNYFNDNTSGQLLETNNKKVIQILLDTGVPIYQGTTESKRNHIFTIDFTMLMTN